MTDGRMISKKELLDKYGISYGALYRWKRMGLIPDEWFVKTASVTGQQTFFPRKLICERIEQILNMKDDVSLSALAENFKEKEQSGEYLTVETDFGTARYKLNEVRKVTVINGDKASVLLERSGEIK